MLSLSGSHGVKMELVVEQVTLLVTKLTFSVLAAANLTAQDHHITAGDVAGSVSAHAEFKPMSTSHLLQAPQAFMLLPSSVVAKLLKQMPEPFRISEEAVAIMTESLSLAVHMVGQLLEHQTRGQRSCLRGLTRLLCSRHTDNQPTPSSCPARLQRAARALRGQSWSIFYDYALLS